MAIQHDVYRVEVENLDSGAVVARGIKVPAWFWPVSFEVIFPKVRNTQERFALPVQIEPMRYYIGGIR